MSRHEVNTERKNSFFLSRGTVLQNIERFPSTIRRAFTTATIRMQNKNELRRWTVLQFIQDKELSEYQHYRDIRFSPKLVL